MIIISPHPHEFYRCQHQHVWRTDWGQYVTMWMSPRSSTFPHLVYRLKLVICSSSAHQPHISIMCKHLIILGLMRIRHRNLLAIWKYSTLFESRARSFSLSISFLLSCHTFMRLLSMFSPRALWFSVNQADLSIFYDLILFLFSEANGWYYCAIK